MSIYHQKYSKKLFTSPNTSFSKIFSLIPSNSKNILDIGCASGYLGKYIKSKYKSIPITGLDNNKEDIKIAKKNLDEALIFNLESDIFPERFKKNKFDVVILADILEHLINPEKLLQNLHQIITSNSTLIISIPNIVHQSTIINLINRKWEYTDTGILDKTHLKFFSRQSICQLLKQNGFVIEKIDFTTKKESLSFWQKPFRFYLTHPDFLAYQYIIKAKPSL